MNQIYEKFAMKKLLLLLICLCSFDIIGQNEEDKNQIINILELQTKAWNAGDVISFMKGYWESDSLMYIGKLGITYGYKPTLEQYKKNYPDLSTMGTLKFDIIKVDFISKDACFVVGKWQLTRPKKGNVSGHYTLLWRKIKDYWVIVADHSS